MKNNLIVSELFYSIQGEGQTVGIPAVFLRLSGCNLLCKGKDWTCDSIEVWKKGTKTDFEDVLSDYLVGKLSQGAHLVITGGEPLLHQTKVVKFLDFFIKNYGFKPVVEIETNGTIIPNDELTNLVDYWNCSPKLSSSGETFKRRVNEVAIKKINEQNKTIFKFVVSEENDILSIIEEYMPFMNRNNVMLMPSGDTQELLDKTRGIVVQLAIDYTLKYSDRLHIVIWNQKTGV